MKLRILNYDTPIINILEVWRKIRYYIRLNFNKKNKNGFFEKN